MEKANGASPSYQGMPAHVEHTMKVEGGMQNRFRRPQIEGGIRLVINIYQVTA
jgi:hypothetical protein